jgi:hypothetical protein
MVERLGPRSGLTSERARERMLDALLIYARAGQPVLVVPTSGRLILIACSQSATV